MSQFTKSRLKCDLVNDRFILNEAVTWEFGAVGSGDLITIPIGFKTDFASIPWWTQWHISKFGKHNIAALLHDYLYSKAKTKIDKISADNEFYTALIATGVNQNKAKRMYLAVKYFGKISKIRN